MRRRLAHRTASASGTLASRTLGKGVCSVRPLRSPETEADRTFSMTGIPFPNIDPIALEIGPLVIRCYALAYIAGLLRSEEHTSELQSLNRISYAAIRLKNKKTTNH